MTADAFTQLWIAVFGVLAIFFVAHNHTLGPVFGLISQPAWLATAYTHRQWGIYFLTLVYTILWLYALVSWENDRRRRR